jgi:endonuclease/exonuclease/phosphatase (EEP) superfamily protein YafD
MTAAPQAPRRRPAAALAALLRPAALAALLRPAALPALLCAAGLLLPLATQALAGFGGPVAWLVDLASHWQWLFLPALLPAVALALRHHRRWAWLLLAAPLPWLTAAPALPAAPPGDGLPRLSVASANVHVDNRDTQALAAWLAAERPHVVVLLEVSPAFAEGLRTLTGYPYRKLVPADTPFGLAVLSRQPLSNVQVLQDAEGMPHIEVDLHWQGRRVRLAALHLMPPLSAHYHGARNDKLRSVAAAAHDSGQPALLVGDLNATPWSSAFTGLQSQGFRRAGGLRPTWPAGGGGWAGIPIDHVTGTAQWTVASSRLGPDVGSDHLPVVVQLVLQPAALH